MEENSYIRRGMVRAQELVTKSMRGRRDGNKRASFGLSPTPSKHRAHQHRPHGHLQGQRQGVFRSLSNSGRQEMELECRGEWRDTIRSVARSSPHQHGFSNCNLQRNHLGILLSCNSDSVGLGWAPNPLFLTNFQVTLMLLFLRWHVEKQGGF